MEHKTIGEIVEFGKKLVGKAKEEEEKFTSDDPRSSMTKEEIEEYMRQEEEQLGGMLGKFIQTNPKPDTSIIDEEDDDEIITLDFEKGEAYEKVAEGVAVRDSEGNISLIDDEAVERRVKELIEKNNEPKKPTAQQKYQDMITDRFVSKAIANLIAKFNYLDNSLHDGVRDAKLGFGISDSLAEKLSREVDAHKNVLRAAIAGGKVHYDKIPDWANSYIDEYVFNALNTVIDFVERD